MKNIEDIEKKFEEYREYLEYETKRLVMYIRLHNHINERKRDRLAELNIAPCFFQVVLDSLFSSIILWVDKLLSNKSERGFWDFLSFIENNKELFEASAVQKRGSYPDEHHMLNHEPVTSQVIENHRKKIVELRSFPSFKLRRDKFYAHFDKKYFFNRDRLDSDAPLRYSDLEEIIRVMVDILHYYSAAYDRKVRRIEPLNVYDIDHLLNKLHECLKEQKNDR